MAYRPEATARARALAASSSRFFGGADRDEVVEEVLRDVRDLVHGAVEGLVVGLGRLGRTRDLADVLQGGGVHLFGRRGRLEVVEGVDAAAHAPDDTPWVPHGHVLSRMSPAGRGE